MNSTERATLRRLIADYMSSEGCRCCQNVDAHDQHKDQLGRLLKVRKYQDGSGYDFMRYRTKKK